MDHPRLVGILDSPGTLHRFVRDSGCRWAGDNGAYSKKGFASKPYRRMLEVMADWQPQCLFIVAPDSVGDAEATLKRFRKWEPELHAGGWPVAFVSQDGLAPEVIPWDSFECFFVGGTDDWKLTVPSVALMAEAKRRGKWLHVGRVNSRPRVLFCHHVGADSFDGTHYGFEPDRAARWVVPMLRWLDKQPTLEGLEDVA